MRRHHPVPVNLFTLFRPAGRRRTRRAVVPQRDEGGSSLTYYFEAPGNPGDLGCLVSLCPLWLDDSFCPFCHSVQNPLPVQPGQAQSSPVKPSQALPDRTAPRTPDPKPQTPTEGQGQSSLRPPRGRIPSNGFSLGFGRRGTMSAPVAWHPSTLPPPLRRLQGGTGFQPVPGGHARAGNSLPRQWHPQQPYPLVRGWCQPCCPPRNQPNRMETRLKSPRIQVNPADTSISFPPRFWPSGTMSDPVAGPGASGQARVDSTENREEPVS